MHIGEKIQHQRKKLGLSQEDLATQLNISRQAVSRWETGEGLPDTEKVIRLSRIFGVSTDYLLLDELESPTPPEPSPPPEAADGEMDMYRKKFRTVVAVWVLALGLVLVVVALILAGVFEMRTDWWYTDLGPFGTGLLKTWRLAPLLVGAFFTVCGVGFLIREYRRD